MENPIFGNLLHGRSINAFSATPWQETSGHVATELLGDDLTSGQLGRKLIVNGQGRQ
jgi:hypothetical protein